MKINEKVYRTIWPITGADSPKNDAGFSVQIIDQTMLPHRFEVKELAHLDEMIVAIKTMQVRGAPLIGAAAAYGMALAVQENASDIHIEKSAKSLLESVARSFGYHYGVKKHVRVNTISQSPTRTTAGSGVKGFDGFINYAEKMSPLGNASAEDCANYCVVMFSDHTRMVTMQNIFHDGGFSFTGVTNAVIEQMEK